MELPATPRRLGALLGTLVLLVALQAEAAVGRTPGVPSVSEDGQAHYSIPIALPPGTNGLTPTLSIDYGHRTRGGLLGVGWSIGGLSEITRCARTVAQDGVTAAPLRDIADRFCLDGQRLVVVNGAVYEAPNAEYRTEIESFARIRAIAGTSTNGPAYFTVEAADGRIYEYGATNDSRIDGSTGPSTNGARSWALNRIRDRAGNIIDYRYAEESGSTAFRIANIQYNANPGNGIAASHQVAFTYEQRPNQEIDSGYVAGMPVREVMRLDRVDVLNNGSVLRRYDLAYEPALSSGGRSRLASIKECGAGGTDCLAPTTFEWQDGIAGTSAVNAFSAQVPVQVAIPHEQAWNLADIDGDGRNDILWAGGTDAASLTIRYRLSVAGRAFGPAINSGISCRYGIGVPFDANGDGRADLLMISAGAALAIAAGGPSGLAAPVDTGIAAAGGHARFSRRRPEWRRPRRYRLVGSRRPDGQQPQGARPLCQGRRRIRRTGDPVRPVDSDGVFELRGRRLHRAARSARRPGRGRRGRAPHERELLDRADLGRGVRNRRARYPPPERSAARFQRRRLHGFRVQAYERLPARASRLLHDPGLPE